MPSEDLSSLSPRVGEMEGESGKTTSTGTKKTA